MSKLNNFFDVVFESVRAKSIFLKTWLPWVFVFGMCVYFFVSVPRQSIGTVNITGIVNNFVETQAKSGLSNEDVRTNVQLFGKNLEKIIHRVSTKNSVVLFPSEAVIAGAKDYTAEVQRQLPVFKQSVQQISKNEILKNEISNNSDSDLSQRKISEEIILPINDLKTNLETDLKADLNND